MNIHPSDTFTLSVTLTAATVEHFEEHGGFTSITYHSPDAPGLFTVEIADAMDSYVVMEHLSASREHRSDCGTHNEPAMAPSPCDCGGKFVPFKG